MNIVDNSPDVEVDDGLAAGGGFEDGEVLLEKLDEQVIKRYGMEECSGI